MAEVVTQTMSLHPLLHYCIATKMLWIAAVRNAEGYSLQQAGLLSGVSSICWVPVLRTKVLLSWTPGCAVLVPTIDSGIPHVLGFSGSGWSHKSPLNYPCTSKGGCWWEASGHTHCLWQVVSDDSFCFPGADCWNMSWKLRHCKEFCLCHLRKLSSSKRQSHLTVSLKKCSQVKRVNRGDSGQLPAAELLIKTMGKMPSLLCFL